MLGIKESLTLIVVYSNHLALQSVFLRATSFDWIWPDHPPIGLLEREEGMDAMCQVRHRMKAVPVRVNFDRSAGYVCSLGTSTAQLIDTQSIDPLRRISRSSSNKANRRSAWLPVKSWECGTRTVAGERDNHGDEVHVVTDG